MNQSLSIVELKDEIDNQVSDPNTVKTLLATAFKGLNQDNIKPAILEGRMRGFSFQDFLQKNIYAIPFKDGYSLVTSIDWARKVGMRSGIVGKSAPKFEVDEGKIISCTVTVKKTVNGSVGEFTATVYFDEYYKAGKGGYPSLWDSKPRTMIAKVAEMHALRMACPEELSQAYVEEERQAEVKPAISIDLSFYETKLRECTNLESLQTVWANMPVQAKEKLNGVKVELKEKFQPKPEVTADDMPFEKKPVKAKKQHANS